ncbi:MAG: DUF1669 domain-containing protein [Bacteroides sp.]|nr:DUF1669 domain-containing protein [Bacteroides sp.]
MQKAHFSNIRSHIVTLLQDANNEVLVAMAWFTSIQLFTELIECLKRGIRVKLILLDSPINFMEYAPDFNEFIKYGGSLYIASSERGLMHHKFCIIDNSIIITGSYNWTYYAETRNVENILISDDIKIVNQFAEEFSRIIGHLQNSHVAPRYSWDTLENMENVDFTDINYEAEQISHILNKPVRQVIETKIQVFVSELKQTPKAAFNIGLLAKDNNNNEIFDIFISKNEILPYTSKEHLLFYNSKKHNVLVNHIIYGDTKTLESAVLLKEEDFNDVTSGLICECLKLNYKMTLDTNGDMKVEVSCMETGKKKTITMLNQKFVKYV